MRLWTIILLIVVVILAAGLVVLYFFSKKTQRQQEEQNEQMKAQAQALNVFVIDKKKLHVKDAGLPKVVEENMPKRAKLAKLPIVKVKAGNKVMSLMCDYEIYKTILPGQEIKAQIAGLYIVGARRIRGPVYEAGKKTKQKKVKNKQGKTVIVTEKKQSWLDKLR